jgi:hypothetical protein
MEQTKSKKRKKEGMNQMKVCLEKENEEYIYISKNIKMQLKFMREWGGM